MVKLTPSGATVKSKKVTFDCGCSFASQEDLEDEDGNEKPGKLSLTLCGQHKDILGKAGVESLVRAALDAE